jgi:hypothetical protein
MTTLENLQPNATLRGILPDALVTVVNVQRFGSEALDLTDKEPDGAHNSLVQTWPEIMRPAREGGIARPTLATMLDRTGERSGA